MDQQPKIPTLKESQKPQVKLRGLGAGLTLLERLKQFKKKDLAFILAGLGTLFMAPLAEHFMMAPDSGDAALRPGFGPGAGGGPGGGGIFGDRGGNMAWENQNGLAPGGPTGGGSDLITPLNVRDPSALVMGPGATQQPPTNSVAPQTPPPTAPVARNESDLKDALAASARGATAAAKKALTPIPKIGLNSSGLRGLGAVSGGSSTSAGLGPINSAGLAPNHAATGGGLTNVRPATGYKGLAARGPGTGGGGIEGLKAAADRAGSAMNRTGNAAADLNAAASQGVPNNGSGFGGYGQGGASANDKAAGGNQGKDGKNQGESLAFLKAKMDMEKANALKWKKKEAADTELQMLQWRNKIGEAVAGKIGEGLGAWITCPMSQAKTGGLKGFGGCWTSKVPHNDWACTLAPQFGGLNTIVPYDSVVDSCASGGDSKEEKTGTYVMQGTSLYQCDGNRMGALYAEKCNGGDSPDKSKKDEQPKQSVGQSDGRLYGDECKAASDMKDDTAGVKAYLGTMKGQLQMIAQDRNKLGGGPGAQCDATAVAAGDSAKGLLADAEKQAHAAAQKMLSAVTAGGEKMPDLGQTELQKAEADLTKANGILNAVAQTRIPDAPKTPAFGSAIKDKDQLAAVNSWPDKIAKEKANRAADLKNLQDEVGDAKSGLAKDLADLRAIAGPAAPAAGASQPAQDQGGTMSQLIGANRFVGGENAAKTTVNGALSGSGLKVTVADPGDAATGTKDDTVKAIGAARTALGCADSGCALPGDPGVADKSAILKSAGTVAAFYTAHGSACADSCAPFANKQDFATSAGGADGQSGPVGGAGTAVTAAQKAQKGWLSAVDADVGAQLNKHPNADIGY